MLIYVHTFVEAVPSAWNARNPSAWLTAVSLVVSSGESLTILPT